MTHIALTVNARSPACRSRTGPWSVADLPLRQRNRDAAGVARPGRSVGVPSCVAILAAAAAASSASAAPVTDIDLTPYYTGSWTGNVYNGPQIAAAPITGNTGTGITFADYVGKDVYTGPDASARSRDLTFAPVPLTNASVVRSLFNSAYGVGGTVNGVVTFNNSSGQQATYDLVGGQTIRDFNNGVFDNGLQGYNTNPTYGAVTASTWWTNTAAGGAQRLDVQTFTLPSSWAGTSLVEMTISDPYTSLQTADDTLSALQVATVPEPTVAALLTTAVAAIGGRRFRHPRRARHAAAHEAQSAAAK